MDIKLKNGLESINRVKLLISYDSSKTLCENISEQEHIVTKSDILQTQWEKETDDQRKIDKVRSENAWKSNCKYPNMAMLPGKNFTGVSGKDGLIDGHCYYPCPSKNGEINGIFIPEDSDIRWWDIGLISYAVDAHLKKPDNKDENKELLIKNFSRIFPLNTVMSFTSNGKKFNTWITYDNNDWSFSGFRDINKKPYEQPAWVDERSDYQRFVDDYGFAIQITAALATAIAGALTGGAAWVLYAEIALEGGLGLAVGLRDVQKGENVSAALSFITGILPILKLTKWFTGIPEKEFIELSKELKNAGLTATSDVSKYVEFYNKLNLDQQKIMSKLLKQDDYFKSQLLKSLDDELPKIVNKGLEKMVKENPKLLQSIPFFEKLWVRELGTNSIFTAIITLINVVWGDKLNDKDRDILDGVFVKLPTETLKKEMAFNLLANGDKAKEIVNTESFKEIKKSLDLGKVGLGWLKWYNTQLHDSIVEPGGTYTELPEDSTTSVENKQGNKYDEKSLRKNGFIPMEELKDGQETSDIFSLNGNWWFKIKE